MATNDLALTIERAVVDYLEKEGARTAREANGERFMWVDFAGGEQRLSISGMAIAIGQAIELERP